MPLNKESTPNNLYKNRSVFSEKTNAGVFGLVYHENVTQDQVPSRILGQFNRNV